MPPLTSPVLDRSLLVRPTLEAARSLLGARLVREDVTGRRVARIVEVEAYIGEADRASHARFGPTDRNRVMYGRPGIAYVYLVYGMHDCLNVVTEPEGAPAAVLVRAVEPLEGADLMRMTRVARSVRTNPDGLAPAEAIDRISRVPNVLLASGPGLVGAAFGLDRTWTGTDLCDPASALRLEPSPRAEKGAGIVAAPRVGIAYAGEPWTRVQWRLLLAGSPALSRPRPTANALGG